MIDTDWVFKPCPDDLIYMRVVYSVVMLGPIPSHARQYIPSLHTGALAPSATAMAGRTQKTGILK